MPAFVRFVLNLVRRFFDDQGVQSAAALTYTTLFAVVPMMTVLFVMLSAIPAFKELGEPVQAFIFNNFMPSSGEQLLGHLTSFSNQARSLTWAGVGALMVTALLTLHTIEKAFNRIWRVRQARRGVSGFLLYWAILSLGPLLLGAGFAITAYLNSLEWLSRFGDIVPGWALLLEQVPRLLEMAAFTLLYATVPNVRVPLKHALIGGIFTALLFDSAKWGFATYVAMFPSYQLIYGAFAAVPLFLFWLYLSWIIVLFGAELVCSLGLPPSSDAGRPQLLNLFGVLAELLKAQSEGRVVQREDLVRAGWSMCEGNWENLIEFLEDSQLVCKVSGGGWVLSRDLHDISLPQLIRMAPWPLPPMHQFPQVLNAPWYTALYQALAEEQQRRDSHMEGSLVAWLGPQAGCAAQAGDDRRQGDESPQQAVVTGAEAGPEKLAD